MDSLSGGRTRTFPYIEWVFSKSFERESVAQMPLDIKGVVNDVENENSRAARYPGLHPLFRSGCEVRLFPHSRGHKVEADTPREWIVNRKTRSWGGQRYGSQKADLPVGCVLNRGRVSAEPLPVSCRSSIDLVMRPARERNQRGQRRDCRLRRHPSASAASTMRAHASASAPESW